MKILKFILLNIIILIIITGIPFFVLKAGTENQHLVKVEGSAFQGPVGYAIKITQDADATEQIRENVMNLNQEYTKLLHAEKKDMLNLFLSAALILGVIIIAFGVFILKATKYKLFSSALITSGILAVSSYITMYITVLSILT
ncbi:MAG: hypothetical protein RSE00_01985 [Clostridia bacterium]